MVPRDVSLVHNLNYFDEIWIENKLFGKASVIKKLLQKHNRQREKKVFYVGDETRDIEAAKKCNIISVAVIWGYNSEEILLREKPDFIVKTPRDILNLPTY